MIVVETSTNKKYKIAIHLVEDRDYQKITKARYFFNWKQEKDFEVYKLNILGSNEILGLISLQRIPQEWRVHIRLLSVSFENKGKNRNFKNIAGNLIAFAAKIAILEYAELACVSLRPKTEIAQHYINIYNMTATGLTLSVEMPEIMNLIEKFDHD